MAFQPGFVELWLATVLAFNIGTGDQFSQIAITGRVFAQQHQAKRWTGVLFVLDPQVHADNGFDPRYYGGTIELDHGKQIALVGDRHRRHAGRSHGLHQWLDTYQAIGQRVFGVEMKVNKLTRHAPKCQIKWPRMQALIAEELQNNPSKGHEGNNW